MTDTKSPYVYTREFKIISKTDEVFYVDKEEYLVKFNYFKELFESKPDLKEIKLQEDSETLKDMFDFLYKKRNGSSVVKSVSYLYTKWMFDLGCENINTLRLDKLEDLGNMYPYSEDYFEEEILEVLDKAADKRDSHGHVYLDKKKLAFLKTGTMYEHLYSIIMYNDKYSIRVLY